MKAVKTVTLIILVSLLILFGITNIYSASVSTDKMIGTDQVVIQIGAVLLGILGIILIQIIPSNKLGKSWSFFVLDSISIVLLSLPLLFGVGNGNTSWIAIPFTNLYIQTSEIVKCIFIVSISNHINTLANKEHKTYELIHLLLHGASYIIVILFQGDVGSAGIYFLIFLTMIFASRISKKFAIAICVSVFAFLPIIWSVIGDVRRARIIAGFFPNLDPTNYGWQKILSNNAISSGGIFGKGLFSSSIAPKIPACCTDMILARIAEEFGLLSSISVVITLFVIVFILFNTSTKTQNKYNNLVFVGYGSWILWQTFISSNMIFGNIPIIGITLPFVSYGGSSMLGLLLGLGLIIKRK